MMFGAATGRCAADCKNRNMHEPSFDPQVTPPLRAWIVAQAAAGCSQADMLVRLCASGWDEAMARAALTQVLQPPAPAASALPAPRLSDAPSRTLPAERPVQRLLTLQRPRLALLGGFLSDAECDALVELARPRLARSHTVAARSGGSEVNAARTSDGMFFERGETPLIEDIEQRIAALLHWPVRRGEGLQVLRYAPGAQYQPHFDYFDPAQPGSTAVLRRGGQRVATLLLYLQVPEQGGATVFPDAGLEVAPVKGHALFFAYEQAQPSSGTLHGGAPVLEGEKWVATKWLRERDFD